MISFQVYLFFVLYSFLHPTVNARKNDQAPTLQSKLIQKLLAYMANTIVYESGITYKADDKQKAVFEKYEKLIKIFIGKERAKDIGMSDAYEHFFREIFSTEFDKKKFSELQLLKSRGTTLLTPSMLNNKATEINKNVIIFLSYFY
jgi:hypothetical protein